MTNENTETFRQFVGVFEEAVNAGLRAAANVYAPAVRSALSQGYTSGDFVGNPDNVSEYPPVVQSVEITNPRRATIRVRSKVPYAAFWELGHHNRYTRKYERVTHWANTLGAQIVNMSLAFSEAFQQTLEEGIDVNELQVPKS